MSPNPFYLASLLCYAAGFVLALASLRWEGLRRRGWQLLAVGLAAGIQTVGIGM